MAQKLFIHIGLPKTGTTSFQFAMSRHRPVLKKHGIYYPATNRPPHPTGTQHRYVNAFMRQQQEREEQGGQASYHVIKRVAQEITKQGFPINVLSEEIFSFDHNFSARYLSRFRDHFDTKIIALIRRQDVWCELMYAQSIRGGYSASFANFLASRHTRERIDYHSFLSDWGSCFGRDNVIAIPYVEKQTDATKAILACLTDAALSLDGEERRNPSMTGEAIEFIRGLSQLSKANYVPFNRLFGPSLLEVAKRGKPVYFRQADRARFLSEYARSNADVAREFLEPRGEAKKLFDIDSAEFPQDDAVVSALSVSRRMEITRSVLAGRQVDTSSVPESDFSEAALLRLEQQLDAECTRLREAESGTTFS